MWGKARKLIKGIRENKEKIELYITSLWLLFLLIIIITIDIPICYEKNWVYVGTKELIRKNVIPIIALILLMYGIVCYKRFAYKLTGSTRRPFTLKKIENVNYEHLTFLTTYIIPLICFDLSSIKYTIVLFLLLVIIGAIYVKTDMFYANPSLALLGFHIYKVDAQFSSGFKENIILISKDKLDINSILHYKKLDEKIYFVKKQL